MNPNLKNEGMPVSLGTETGILIPKSPLTVKNCKLKWKVQTVVARVYYLNPIIILFTNYIGIGINPPVLGRDICWSTRKYL